MGNNSFDTHGTGRLRDARADEPPDEEGPLRHRRRDAAVLIIGIASILAVFLFPTFLLKLGVLIAGVVCIGRVMIPWVFGPERARAVAMALFASTIAFAGGLVLAEFAVRLAFADVTTTPDGNSYFALRWKEEISTNTLGFREREISPRLPEGVYRIAVIGDSFTWGQGIARSDRMTEQLEALLRDANLNAEVLNFGRAGSETVDHVETLQDVVLPLQPDFVLLQWFVNDVEGQDKSSRPKTIRLLPSDAAMSWLHRRSALYYLVDQQWRKLQVAVGLVGNYQDYMDQRFADAESPDMIAAETALQEFISIAADAGIGVGIVAFPIIELVESPGEFTFGYLIDRVMDVCAAHGIGCVDLREALAGVADTDGWWASKFDPHPGPHANEVAANAVAANFRSRWVPATNAR